MNKIMETEKKIENAVVGGYKAVENAFVGGYKKIEKGFVDAFLTPDDEKQSGSGADKKATNPGETIGDGVITGYKAIENGVVTGYKAIEKGVVAGYKAVENGFTKTFMQPDDSTEPEAPKED